MPLSHQEQKIHYPTKREICCMILFLGFVIVIILLVAKEKEISLKYHPVNVFIKWSSIRKYLINNFNKMIPNIYNGTSLKVRRCLHFMTNACDFCEKSLCKVSEEEIVVEYITLTYNGNLSEYYAILFAQHKACNCIEKSRDADLSDDPLVIRDGRFIKL